MSDASARRRVLVALDDTDASARAAAFVNSFFDPATTDVMAVNVTQVSVPWVPPIPFGGLWVWAWTTPGSAAGYEMYPAVAPELEIREARADALGEQALVESGVVNAEHLVERGDPATAIQRAASEHDASLIVVGSHDETALSRLLFGSVSQDLVRHADRPVLVVR